MTFSEFREEKYNMCPFDWSFNEYRFRYPVLGGRDSHGDVSSDVSAHLPFLQYIASMCDHVTEFGFRTGCSASALIAGCRGKVVSYDQTYYGEVEVLKNMQLPCKWEFVQSSTIDPSLKIEQTDFLHIDTLHTYNQVRQELRLHHNKVNRFISFHDTFSHGMESLDIPGQNGILDAINEFLEKHKEWKKVYDVKFNHGIILIERK